MRIAILYTGEVRTIEKTISYLYANLIDPNPDAHLFMTIQSKPEDQERYQELLENNIPIEQLKSLEWFQKEDPIWRNIQSRLISNLNNITEQWRTYLRTSGSMIEYYQLYLSYLKMVEYENKNGFQYDYVMRFRTDSILNKPLDLSWTNHTIPEIQIRMQEIQSFLKDTTITPKHIYYYMNSVFDNNRIHYLDDQYSQFSQDAERYSYYQKDKEIERLIEKTNQSDPSTFYEQFQEYIQNGNYLISFRKNVIYFTRRENFYFIPFLGISYGTFNNQIDQYWFNSENQFQYCCMKQKMTIFDSRTELEDKSLYEYNPSNYFENELIKECSSFFFILCRK